MIQVTLLPLSSLETERLRKWLRSDEAILLLQLINEDVTHLEAKLANEIAKSSEFKNYVVSAENTFKDIQRGKHFLEIWDNFLKVKEFHHIKLEVKHER